MKQRDKCGISESHLWQRKYSRIPRTDKLVLASDFLTSGGQAFTADTSHIFVVTRVLQAFKPWIKSTSKKELVLGHLAGSVS